MPALFAYLNVIIIKLDDLTCKWVLRDTRRQKNPQISKYCKSKFVSEYRDVNLVTGGDSFFISGTLNELNILLFHWQIDFFNILKHQRSVRFRFICLQLHKDFNDRVWFGVDCTVTEDSSSPWRPSHELLHFMIYDNQSHPVFTEIY